jgi:transcriptional regulator with XRE-family HTH domain
MTISKPSLPQWSRNIKSLRSSLKLSQSEFGKSLRFSAMAVSRWERGRQPPPAECYLAMAKIAGPSFGWKFWSLVGISEDDVERMHALRTRTKNEQHDFSAAVAVLEIEVARSEARATQRDALFQDLPTQTLRREYQAIARAEAKFARIVALHMKTLRGAIR